MVKMFFLSWTYFNLKQHFEKQDTSVMVYFVHVYIETQWKSSAVEWKNFNIHINMHNAHLVAILLNNGSKYYSVYRLAPFTSKCFTVIQMFAFFKEGRKKWKLVFVCHNLHRLILIHTKPGIFLCVLKIGEVLSIYLKNQEDLFLRNAAHRERKKAKF